MFTWLRQMDPSKPNNLDTSENYIRVFFNTLCSINMNGKVNKISFVHSASNKKNINYIHMLG